MNNTRSRKIGNLRNAHVSPWIAASGSGFWRGFGSVLNLGHSQNLREFETPWWVRDAEAIAFDWYKVGQDFEEALSGELSDES